MKKKPFVSTQLSSYSGSFYGLVAPVLMGKFEIVNNENYDIELIDSFMWNNFSFDIHENDKRLNEPSACYGESLLNHFFFWYCQIHKLAKIPVSKKLYLKKMETTENTSVFTLAFSYHHPKASTMILETLQKIFSYVLSNSKNPLTIKQDELSKYLDLLRPYSFPGTNNRFFVQAAIDLNIPYKVLRNELLIFGHGKNLKKLSSSSTDQTSFVGASIAKEKTYTSAFLKMNALPVAPQLPANSLEETVNNASNLGYPVVIKPSSEDQGVGVSSNIKTEADLKIIYENTEKKFNNLIIEKHIEGEDYRFTVFEGEVIKIMHRTAGGVIGDGFNNISSLVTELQNKPENHRRFLQKGKHALELDHEALSLIAEKNYTPETVLKKNEYLCLRRQSNISTGGSINVIENNDVHPDNLALAIQAADLFSLDMAGIDLISKDITESWMSNNAVICEVNAVPQIGISQSPLIYEQILRHYMDSYRIPIHLKVVTQENLESPVFFQSLLEQPNIKNFSLGKYVVVNKQIISNKALHSFHSAVALLTNHHVDQAYCYMSPELIKKTGLPFDKCNSVEFEYLRSEVEEIVELIQQNTSKMTFIDS